MHLMLKQMALNARIDRQRMTNPPTNPIHPETALEMQLVQAGLHKAISSKNAFAAAKLAGSKHPEDIDEQLASWL
jgi:hypothetical protein